MGVVIDVGGGLDPHPDATIVIDLTHPRGAPAQNAASRPWTEFFEQIATPIRDSSVDAIVSSHTLEHIPAGDRTIFLMNEAHRVLKPGGTFTILLPVIGWTDPWRHPTDPKRGTIAPTWQAWADPTHVNYYWMPESFHYFTGQLGAAADYGIALWAPLPDKPEARPPGERWPPPGDRPFWSVRGDWEGVVRLVKP